MGCHVGKEEGSNIINLLMSSLLLTGTRAVTFCIPGILTNLFDSLVRIAISVGSTANMCSTCTLDCLFLGLFRLVSTHGNCFNL